MPFGAGTVLARKVGAREIVDPRPFAAGSLAETFQQYPAIGPLLPAMGYGEEQVCDLEATIARVPCEVVVVGTPIDLSRIITIPQPAVRVRYELQEIGRPDLAEALGAFLQQRAAPAAVAEHEGARQLRVGSALSRCEAQSRRAAAYGGGAPYAVRKVDATRTE